jgi:2-polyprenyl-6-hydroxyphenyl methylase/3-demethylubiquinone-9 3-methyltransferase
MDRLVHSVRHGARIYMSIDAHRFRPMKLLFRLLPFDVLHPHQYDVDEYERMLISRGCDIERRVRVRTHPLFHYMLIIARRR